MSVIGQQNLSKSQNDLTTSMERLSSGLRINSANRMSSQITGLSTEGALNQVNDNLQRIRELAVQAGANDGETITVDRASLNLQGFNIDGAAGG